MKTITFYSYKGGVGRSLALSQVAIRLSEYQKKVCVLDFDLEAPGLNFKFQNYDKERSITKGVVDYISEFTTSGQIPNSIKEFSVRLNPRNPKYRYIDLIPAGDIEQDDYWTKLSKIDWTNLFYKEQGLGVKFFLDLKARIKKELKPDFLLIDSRTGITDIAGITLRLLADEAVILAANNEENMFGSKKIIKSLIDPEKALFGSVPKIHFVLTRLPFNAEPNDRIEEDRIVKKRKKQLLSALQIEDIEVLVIRSDRRLEKNERHLMEYELDEKDVSISNDYLRLFEKLTSGLLSEQEKEKFMNQRKAEQFFNKSRAIEDVAKKIQLLEEAVRYDESNIDYVNSLGVAYWELKDTENAKIYFERALSKDPSNAYILNNLGVVNMKSNPIISADYFRKAISIEPYYALPYLRLSHILRDNGELSQSISLLNKAVEITEEDDTEYLSLTLNARADAHRLVGNYDSALQDIFKAISINSGKPAYFGTLAEIYAEKGMVEEFYLNLSIALAKGISTEEMNSARDVYMKFKDDERFLELLRRYDLDLNVILGEDEN